LNNGKALVERQFVFNEEDKQQMWGKEIKLPKGVVLPPVRQEFNKGVLPLIVWPNRQDPTLFQN